MKKNLFLSLLFIFFTTSAFAKVATTEQEVNYTKSAIQNVLASSDYRLVEDSIDLDRIMFFDGVMTVWNTTVGLAMGQQDGQVYKVVFEVEDHLKNRRSGEVYLFTRDGQGSYNETQRSIENTLSGKPGFMYLALGLLAQNQSKKVTTGEIIR